MIYPPSTNYLDRKESGGQSNNTKPQRENNNKKKQKGEACHFQENKNKISSRESIRRKC